ncbi:SDR family oxidoreductase [Hymenobacter volaticus]|uniref:SDR family oxidoreductase n=1 Tax=Hymenobacter volaticus TaxID=2932254 RepID=A0ABY4GEK6_9BACT|nr:SDR family oxidoreductase [Hymenobacter volaticus]UOQ69329.1 SDR family oxidoreductase [Hymenobacter volaticus]
MKLQDKVAVITGGNSGIGFGIAQEFKREGAKGAIVGRNPETLAASAHELGDDFLALRADVTQLADLERVFQTVVDTFGKLDTLVVNAGGATAKGTVSSVISTTEEEFQQAIDLNLKSFFFTVQKALPYLQDEASIVLVASMGAHKAFAGLTLYTAAKAAIVSFARSFSQDLLARNIRVNVVSPGIIDTPVYDKFGLSEEEATQQKIDLAAVAALKRMGTPSEIGRVAVFLASEDSSFMLGSEVLADGGPLTCKGVPLPA